MTLARLHSTVHLNLALCTLQSHNQCSILTPMASNSVCLACRHALRQQLPYVRPTSRTLHSQPSKLSLRLFTSSNSHSAAQASPRPYKIKEPPAPTSSSSTATVSGAVHSENGNPSPISTTAAAPSSDPVKGIAKEIRKRASSITETYVAYGACEKLVKECARQADYKIPQAHEKNVEVPKTKDGEELGVGTGWWYEGKSS